MRARVGPAFVAGQSLKPFAPSYNSANCATRATLLGMKTDPTLMTNGGVSIIADFDIGPPLVFIRAEERTRRESLDGIA